MKHIKRGLLAACSAVWLAGMLGLMWKWGTRPLAAEKTVEFPYLVTGTTLRIDGIALYEGEMTVGGERRFVSDAMALLITNLGQEAVGEATVTIWIENTPYRFIISLLPPTQTVLAMEVSGAAYAAGTVQRCTGSASCRQLLPLRIEEDEAGAVIVTNTAAAATGSLLLHYGRWEAQSGIYIGSDVHSLPIDPLLPGQALTVQPPEYAYGYSRVMGITEE